MAAKWGTDSRKTHLTARAVLLAGAMACCAPAYAQSVDSVAEEESRPALLISRHLTLLVSLLKRTALPAPYRGAHADGELAAWIADRCEHSETPVTVRQGQCMSEPPLTHVDQFVASLGSLL